jgi:hypothetical protein
MNIVDIGVWEPDDERPPKVRVTINDPNDGTERTVWLSLSERAMEWTIKKLRAIGFNGDVDNPQWTAPNPVFVKCRHDEYDGEVREEWDLLLPGSKPSDKTVESFNRAWKDMAEDSGPAKTAQPPKRRRKKAEKPEPEKETDAPIEDSEIPGVEQERELTPGATFKFFQDVYEDDADEAHWYAILDEIVGHRNYDKYSDADWQTVQAHIEGVRDMHTEKADVPESEIPF